MAIRNIKLRIFIHISHGSLLNAHHNAANRLRYSIIGSKILNMLEFTSQSIACDIPASQELWNAPSQVCDIAACGWAYTLKTCLYSRCAYFSFFVRNNPENISIAKVSLDAVYRHYSWERKFKPVHMYYFINAQIRGNVYTVNVYIFAQLHFRAPRIKRYFRATKFSRI